MSDSERNAAPGPEDFDAELQAFADYIDTLGLSSEQRTTVKQTVGQLLARHARRVRAQSPREEERDDLAVVREELALHKGDILSDFVARRRGPDRAEDVDRRARRILARLRTHSPEERKPDQIHCVKCGGFHACPKDSPEEPVGYIVVGVDAGDKPNPSTASRRVFRTLIQAQEIREHLEQHGVFDAYVIFPIGQPLDGEPTTQAPNTSSSVEAPTDTPTGGEDG